jgi:hypothetical protein
LNIMTRAADIGEASPAPRGKLDDIMLAMDVVDTLRHREDLVTRELDDAGKEEALLRQLREIYRQQGIAVPDHILKDGVKALRESRFAYTPPGAGLKRSLATLYVNRSAWGRRVLAVAAALGVGWGIWQFMVVQPARQSAEAGRIELTQTLPARLASSLGDVRAMTIDAEALTRAEALKADGERALRNGDRPAAQKAVDDLAALRTQLASEYVLTIVSRQGAETGVWRRPPRNPTGRNYYLIVEAVAPDGRKLSLPVRNEETGETETVSMWGIRVPQEMFERIARDKRDDGIVQFNRFGVKRRGMLNPEYLMPFEGGMITKW